MLKYLIDPKWEKKLMADIENKYQYSQLASYSLIDYSKF